MHTIQSMHMAVYRGWEYGILPQEAYNVDSDTRETIEEGKRKEGKHVILSVSCT